MAAAPNKDDLRARFEAAAAAAKSTRKRPDNPTLLKLYSYYKQATDGDVKGDRPGGFDFVG
ncbi:MAG: acyl-CoA-binding protein, partial [Betaproteobacteria bacterium]|nr:acyl-CoA-binding protein [Betaproteobacteria bacterium]